MRCCTEGHLLDGLGAPPGCRRNSRAARPTADIAVGYWDGFEDVRGTGLDASSAGDDAAVREARGLEER